MEPEDIRPTKHRFEDEGIAVPRKRVRFDDTAEHRGETEYRRDDLYKRSNAAYQPGKYAAVEGHAHLNTSGFNIPWASYYRVDPRTKQPIESSDSENDPGPSSNSPRASEGGKVTESIPEKEAEYHANKVENAEIKKDNSERALTSTQASEK